jgi:hypothetical protein
MAQNPLLAHDLTALRRTAIMKVATIFSEGDKVDGAMKVQLAFFLSLAL